ncbi:MAG: methylmalonyl-CoA mutase small subunit [Bacteroidales bacterium]|nr:methylmalonyl-CoA mutase small subunit [Bacteroidales bacterium]
MAISEDRLLFSAFPPVSTSEWEAKIKEDLKGGDYEKRLVWKTTEGFRIKPYYRAEDLGDLCYQQTLPGEFPFLRGTNINHNSWKIRQQVWVKDPVNANRKALDLMEKGCTSIDFVFTKDSGPSKFPFAVLLHDFPLNTIELNFSGYDADVSVEMLVAWLRNINLKNEELNGSVNFDPLGRLCTKGNFTYDSDILSIKTLLNLIKDSAHLPRFRTIGINARNFANAGSSVIQELAFGLAMGAEYLDILTEKGLSVMEAAGTMGFHFAVSSNYFLEIAKFRASRLLWSRIVEAFDQTCKAPMHIHAETAKWNMTVYDPYVNMLRTTTESMSAILAGVDALTVIPFDMTFKKPSAFAERIARNQQIILKEEAYFDKVIDPAAGSYYIESLTESVAMACWNLFLEVQRKGGFVSAMKQGFIQEQVSENAKRRKQAIATRSELSLGTNHFPDFNEIYSQKPLDCVTGCSCIYKDREYNHETEACHCDCREGTCDCSCCNEARRIVQPLQLSRGTREFEKLRLSADLGGYRPKVFMLTIGNLSMRLVRSQFSCNFFACGGYEVIDNIGFSTLDEGLQAAFEAKAEVIVLCSSDEENAVFAPEAYKKIGETSILVIAGIPPCMEELKATGIKYFIHTHSDALEILKQFHQQLGIHET